MHTECDICRANSEQLANLLKTKHWLVNLSYDQGYLGRAYVTLRRHKGTLSDLTQNEWLDYIDIVKRLEKACGEALGATLFNWACLMNNAYQHKPSFPHVHWHFRPRYEKPVTINNENFDDPHFGQHYSREYRRTVDEKTFNAIIDKIKLHL